MNYSTNEEAFEASKKVLVGGVNSPVRSFGSVGGTPYVVDRAEGAHVYDLEGNRYIDYVQSYGPCILGHAHPRCGRRHHRRPPSGGPATERRPRRIARWPNWSSSVSTAWRCSG